MGKLLLTCPTAPSDTGAYRLHWETPTGNTLAGQGQVFRLEENGALLYRGPQTATTVSGRPEGDYAYRVGVVAGREVAEWSVPCTVAVRPPSLGLAAGLFSLGLLVFVATVVLVVRGHRAHRRGSGRS